MMTNTGLYYHPDHLGSTSIVTDASGNIVHLTTYTPYGKTNYELNLGVSVNTLYTGQQYDREAALYYYNARYYDPQLGRFIQPDTIVPYPGDSQAYNRYAYCRNNPIMMTDPTGHWNIMQDVRNFVDDAASWVDDNIVEEVRDTVQNNRFVKDSLFFSTMGVGGVGLSLAGISSFNEARPYVGTAVGAGITAASGGAGAIVGGISGSMITAYLAGGKAMDVVKAGLIGGAQSAALYAAGSAFPAWLDTAPQAQSANWFTGDRVANQAMRMASRAAINGGANELRGGDFADGALWTLAADSVEWSMDILVEYQYNAEHFPAHVDPDQVYNTDTLSRSKLTWMPGHGYEDKNGMMVRDPGLLNIGIPGRADHWWQIHLEDSGFMRFVNRVPGMNSMAVRHDYWAGLFDNSRIPTAVYSQATIPIFMGLSEGILWTQATLANRRI